MIETTDWQKPAATTTHPIRTAIVTALERGVASPSQVAEAIGEALGTVSYHFRVLKEAGEIELVRTKPVRGAVEHFYRPTDKALAAARWEAPQVERLLELILDRMRVATNRDLATDGDVGDEEGLVWKQIETLAREMREGKDADGGA